MCLFFLFSVLCIHIGAKQGKDLNRIGISVLCSTLGISFLKYSRMSLMVVMLSTRIGIFSVISSSKKERKLPDQCSVLVPGQH